MWVKWMKRRGDEIALALALIVVGGLFVATSVTTILDGLDHADDAYVAMAAKSLATGRGYGVPVSSARFVPFDVNITTGPTMTLPLAAVSAVAGFRDRLPGTVALIIFAAQLIVAAALLRRRAGTTAAVAAGGMFVLLLLITSRTQWLYGVFMGEPVAAGFVLLAGLLLATTESRRAAFAAGVMAAAAILTKLIAVFAAAGLTVAFAIVLARDQRRREAALRLAAYVLGGAVPILAFEAFRLSTLGPAEYVANWQTTLAVGSTTGITIADPVERLTRYATSVGTRFVSVGVALAIVAAIAAAVWRSRVRARSPAPAWLTMGIVLLSAGVIAHAAYVATRGTVSPRYVLIGLLALLAIAALVTVILRPRVRLAVMAVILGSSVVLDPQSVSLDRPPGGGDAHGDRLAIVRLLDENATVAYAADHWATLYQFVYPRPGEGRFAYGTDVGQFLDERLLALVDRRFAIQGGHFVTAVAQTCRQLTQSATNLHAYDCGETFWNAYLPAAQLAPGRPPFTGEARDGGECNVDFYGAGAPTGQFAVVDRDRRAAIDGWALDAQGGEPNRAVELLLEGLDGAAFHSPLTLEPRPDLASRFGRPALVPSGFRGAVFHGSVAPGRYRLFLVMDTARGVVRCDTRVTVEVR